MFEEYRSAERRVHVAMEVRGTAEEKQPDLIAAVQTQHGNVGRCRPVRYALRPDSRYHLAVLEYHHRCLFSHKHVSQLNKCKTYL